ncbi:MAG: hypothetical protein A2341_21680 [Deltaproteobacteria bacterium RIFOXYB12_FULL_58_9]|nr:MAG: hypothetical protein A2341_21680 [Deltaproteobacteria bacterium RIFOXYB12_FULL_58_9]
MSNQGVAIIGAGPAGVAAAITCKRLGVEPLLLDASGTAGGLVANAFLVENYPGTPPTPGPKLADLLQTHLARIHVDVLRARACAIVRQVAGWRIDLEGEEATHCQAVIVAVGTVPKTLGGKPNIHAFHDVRHLLSRHPTPSRVVVVGGGEAACDYSLTLAGTGAEVHLLVRGSALRAGPWLLERVTQEPSILIHPHCTAHSIEQVGDQVRVQVEDRHIFADTLLVAIGRRSAAPPLLHCAGVQNDEISYPDGLYVVGDARAGSLGQIGIAVGDGMWAATSAARLVGVG